MAGLLTRGEIIDQGLQLGGNPGLTTRARVYLNLALRRLETAFAWDHLQKEDTSLTTTAQSEVVSLSGITDFRKVVELWQGAGTSDSAGNRPLTQRPWREIWAKINRDRAQSQYGRPREYAVDTNGNRLIFWPIPDDARGLRLLYLSQTAEQDTSDTATYDADTPTFPDSTVLVNLVAEYARRWDSDPAYAIAKSAVNAVLEDILMADQSEFADGLQIQLSPAVHRTWRQDGNGSRWPEE